MTVVSMSISATNDGENQIMAYNIAREGVEAIRNIRDTNWLKFPGDHLNCWDTLNATKAQDCVNSIKLSNATYWASLETDPGSNALFKWEVGTEDSNPQTDDFLLYENPVGNDTILNHDPTGVPGIFHRSIALIKGNNTMQITSKVWWESKGRNHEVRFVDELNNY
ncbi:TPA: hypothetical protein DGH83_03240 [Candidatus Peregrinibacteria bacterium]|nr:hypothetical protein [Candidatus Peregrinibacteria bacterium]